ncbi:hypothetical protein LZ198_23150 [Myxococcus sp. K15C18031901]|uniref:hypothetical protein n=1 Tax=Myxococcus dinghuensis TaxID=2906761 RepID=UPI0020A700BC|nr:hypothetical protein [Myxococcus dinghuensis]MCP3101779.1 hypothetical protein [Myxococcus dinghuensis]
MKRLLFAALLTATSLAPLACDLEKTGAQLTADHVMVGTLLATPEVAISPSATAGFDGGTWDGGDTLTFPAQTAALVFFGSKKGENSQPSGVGGAKASVQPVGGVATVLEEDGSGSYSLTSVGGEDEELTYQSGATYQFIASKDGKRYVGQVEDAPVKESIAAFRPSGAAFVTLDANTALTFDRTAPPANQERTLGFVTVVPLSSDGEKGEPTYSSMPTTPVELLQLVAVPGAHREARMTIPGSAFPSRNALYMVIFQSVRLGGAESDNLFIGSALLAGTADVGIVRTR